MQVEIVSVPNAVRNIDMAIEATPDRQLSSNGDPTKLSSYSNSHALARNNRQTQTESTTKTIVLRKIAKPQVFRVQSKQSELVAVL